MDTTNLDMSAIEAHQVGADKIANCIGAIADHPNKDLFIIDLGIATTFGLVTKGKKYLSGSTVPGVKLSLNALCQGASQLSSVTIVKPEVAISYDTKNKYPFRVILWSSRRIKRRSIKEFGSSAYTIATGGFTGLFKEEGIFD